LIQKEPDAFCALPLRYLSALAPHTS
jgi:hypothetical protein